VGRRWPGRGTAFAAKPTRLECTLLAYWGEGHQAPWLILTEVPPEAAEACWYGLRAWIEQGFKKIKGGGWQWQSIRMNRSRPGGTALVSHRHRHLVVARRRGRSRSDPPDRDVSHRARFAPPARPTLAVGGHLPPWLVVDRGRTLQPSAVTYRPRLPRTLARPAHFP